MGFENALTDADRFWSKVDRSGDCWLWKGALDGHGYGKLSIGQEMLKAHTVAWFLVMGRWPKDNLYRVCPVALDRRCVRPHHMREGAPHRAIARWSSAAESGFPPEFRKASAQFMPTEQAQDELMPLLLYRGALNPGRAQALFNFTILAQKAEAHRLGDVVELSRAWPDASHAVGLHKPMSTNSTPAQFWGRLLQHPKITDTQPGLRDYIREVLAVSKWRPIALEPISRYSHWSTRRWRSMRRRHVPVEPMPEVWPFFDASTPLSEHDLVAAVDAAVPKSLPELVRQDVCQDLILAILEGQVGVGNLRDATAEHVKGVFRQYPSKYGMLSLDAPAPWSDDGRTLGDTLADAPVILGGAETSLSALRARLLAEESAA